MAEEKDVKARLMLMERKLYRFITPWMLLTLVFGFWLLFDYA
jgi:putative membrane protein